VQREERWKEETIGGSGESLSKAGCTVWSLSMALSHYGVNLTPKELNRLLKLNGGYTWRGCLKRDAISKVSQNEVAVEVVTKPSHAQIDATLKSGRPVLAKVLISHVIPYWVLLVGKDGVEYMIRDPRSDGKSVDRLSNYGSDIYGMRIVRPSDGSR
jgi:peptidase C39-like protein